MSDAPRAAGPQGHTRGVPARPWEGVRDRTSCALGFAAAFATDAFLDLSRTFINAVQSGQVENQPVHSAEGVIRLDDEYHLHKALYGAHQAASQSVASMSVRQREHLQQVVGCCAVCALAVLSIVHITFVTPLIPLSAGLALSKEMYDVGVWKDIVVGERDQCQTPTVLRLEITNASWPQTWLQPHVSWFQQASEAIRARHEATERSQENQDRSATFGRSLGSVFLPRMADLALWGYKSIFPMPRYEIMCGGNSTAWLEMQSPKARAAIGVKMVSLTVSARDEKFFGSVWTRE
eukprot:167745-Amphidinium_carterae.1